MYEIVSSRGVEYYGPSRIAAIKMFRRKSKSRRYVAVFRNSVLVKEYMRSVERCRS